MKTFIKRFYRNYLNNSGIYHINTTGLPPRTRRALVIYVTNAVSFFIKGRLQDFPLLNSHTGFWESVELVRQLNQQGFIVDIINYDEKYYNIKFEEYEIIFDIADNLKDSKRTLQEGQVKVFYSTGAHWLYHNQAELNRIESFYKREGIMIKPKRSMKPFFSDLHADYITCFGTDFTKNTFVNKRNIVSLNISATYVPDRNLVWKKNKNKFVWFGGTGAIHKGLDLVMDGFAKIQGAELHIVGAVDEEADFSLWFQRKLKDNPTFFYHGWMEVGSARFNQVIGECVGTVFPSCAEGGPGSVAQLFHYGIIPIVTKSAGCIGEHLGYVIASEEPAIIIEEIVRNVNHCRELGEREIQEKASLIREFALKNHTREAYAESLKNFLVSLPPA